ncbi:hypothetical protein [Methanobrevibacter sp.]|uniref:hypothetical protein n=1 Tax=Methanobrevibacter sp. TaxID=66852 RepID=UPI00388F4F41
MNKKILTILLLLIAVSTIAIVSAADTQTVGGVEFNIPEGYTYDKESVDVFLQSFEDDSALNDAGVFKNSDDEILVIIVYNDTPETDFPDDYKLENKTINNKTGTFATASSRINVGFLYQDGDKYIAIQAMDEDTIKATIK